MARVLGLIFLFVLGFGFFRPVSATSYVQAYDSCLVDLDYVVSHYSYMHDPYCGIRQVANKYAGLPYFAVIYTSSGGSGTYEYGGTSFSPDVCSAGERHNLLVPWSGGTGLGPTYSNIGSCQCVFSPRLGYGPDYNKISGVCTETGNQFGDYTSGNPPEPDPPPRPDVPADPPLCGGGSCYDPGTNQFCATNEDGEQACVPGPRKAPPDAGKIPQTCVTSGAETVCAGTPKGPMPDVGLHTTSSVDDVVQTSDGGTTVYTGTVTVIDTSHQGNNEDPGDGSTSTGKLGNGGNNGSEGKADSAGTCSDGKTPSAGGCGAGYADRGCDAPPTCSGDPLLCAGVKEQHATRCAQAKARASLADASSANAALDAQGFPAADADPSQGDYVQSVDVGGDGGPSLDSTGWGLARTCPIESKSFVLMGQSVTIDYGQACGALSLGSILVMIMAYLAAARILFFRG